jgi:hypothetical protein
VIPVYNPGSFIEPCIASLVDQSLPAERFEVIFVDDGSTDDTPRRLDALATETPNVRVIHEPNSGWSGRPRNVGTDAAVGEYVFFCDHDDWLSPEALERMVGYADENAADILLPKMVGHNRSVPSELYRENHPYATLLTAPLMSSLTPHKLFRRSFLAREGLRFPEGRRRLEDHVFVVAAYLRASRIAVLADYPCYHHIRRGDDANAGYGQIDPVSYFGYLREVLDVIERDSEPGEVRETVLTRPFIGEMLGRVSRQRAFGGQDEDHQEALFIEVRKLMLERFPADFADSFGSVTRARAAAVRSDDRHSLVELNERVSDLELQVELDSMEWTGSAWRATITGRCVFSDNTPLRLIGSGDDRWTVDPRLLPEGLRDQADATTDQATDGRLSMVITERSSDEEWFVPTDLAVHLLPILDDRDSFEIVVTGCADLDPTTLAGGRPLSNGLWDPWLRFSPLGLDVRARLRVSDVAAFAMPNPALVGHHPVVAIPYLTEGRGALTIDVGQRKQTLAAALKRAGLGEATISGQAFSIDAPVDVASGASPRTIRLLLIEGSTVVGRVDAELVRSGSTGVISGETLVEASGGAGAAVVSAGRYALGIRSRPKDEPTIIGSATVDDIGEVTRLDIDTT